MIWKFAFCLVLWPVIAVADCDVDIQPSDTIGSVKAKLNCWAAENLNLKKELKAKAETYTPMKITWSNALAEAQPSTTECVSKAISVIQKRNWTLVTQDKRLAEFTNKNNMMVVDCSFHQIFISGPDESELEDIRDLFYGLIFPKN